MPQKQPHIDVSGLEFVLAPQLVRYFKKDPELLSRVTPNQLHHLIHLACGGAQFLGSNHPYKTEFLQLCADHSDHVFKFLAFVSEAWRSVAAVDKFFGMCTYTFKRGDEPGEVKFDKGIWQLKQTELPDGILSVYGAKCGFEKPVMEPKVAKVVDRLKHRRSRFIETRQRLRACLKTQESLTKTRK